MKKKVFFLRKVNKISFVNYKLYNQDLKIKSIRNIILKFQKQHRISLFLAMSDVLTFI